MGAPSVLVLHRKSANREEVRAAVEQVKGKGIPFRVRVAWNKKDKRRAVKEALRRGATRIVAGGGDGTINDVANALLTGKSRKADTALGILPLGTANDFAHANGIPCDDLAAALEMALRDTPRKIDVGKVNDRYFVNVVSGGFGAEVTAETPTEMKRTLGGAAYGLMGLVKARHLQPYRGTLSVPGESPTEGSMLFKAVGNSRLAGGGFRVAPEAELDDGLLDLAVLRDAPASALPAVLRELDDVTNPENRYVYYRQLGEFEIAAEGEVHFNVDGEPMRESHLHFTIAPKALGVVTGS